MTALASKGQIGAIHAVKKRLGLDDAAYRLLLAGSGVRSSKELSSAAAARLLDRLNEHQVPLTAGATASEAGKSERGPSQAPLARGSLHLTGPYAKVCRALWLSAWNLGLVADRTDKALTAFVKRQTGVDSLNWVRDPAEGARAIEGLKAWIARDGGVTWPTEAKARKAGLSLARARKLAVIAAQKERLGCAHWGDPEGLTDADLDEAMGGFGRAIRAMKPEGSG